MQDRVPTPGKENRVRIRLDDGQTIEGVLEYADEASVQGSAYNKANVLPDDVCALLGIPTLSEPKDAFEILNDKAESNYVVGTYVGNGTTEPFEINLGFMPKFVAITATTDMYVNAYANTGYFIQSLRRAFFFRNHPVTYQTSTEYKITESGFYIKCKASTTDKYANGVVLNHEGLTYSYFALK